jgi:hypothetical protein
MTVNKITRTGEVDGQPRYKSEQISVSPAQVQEMRLSVRRR